MLKVLSQAIKDGTLPKCKLKWPKQGTLSDGKFSTPKTSVYLKTGSASLSSVLEENVDEKYYLSEENTKKILGESGKRCLTQ